MIAEPGVTAPSPDAMAWMCKEPSGGQHACVLNKLLLCQKAAILLHTQHKIKFVKMFSNLHSAPKEKFGRLVLLALCTCPFASLLGNKDSISAQDERKKAIPFKLLSVDVCCFLIFCASLNSSHKSYANVMANLTSLNESSFKAIIVQNVTWFGTVSRLCKVILLLFALFLNQRQMQTSMFLCLYKCTHARIPPLYTLGFAAGATDSLQTVIHR